MTIKSKADKDRVRQKASARQRLVEDIEKLLKDYDQGAAASATLANIRKLIDRTK